MKINCLIKNTEAFNIVKDLIIEIADSDYDNLGIQSNPASIYAELRKSGLEVDLRTVAEIYLDNLSTKNSERYMSVDEVELIGSIKTTQMINSVLFNDNTKVKEIGDMSPSQAVVDNVIKLFMRPYRSETLKSKMRMLQDIVSTGMTRYLMTDSERGISRPKDDRSFDQIAQDAFDKLDEGFTDLHGYVNGIVDLHKEVLDEMQETIDKMEQIGTPESIYAAGEISEFVKEFLASTSALMLSRTEAKNMVYGALKSVDEGKFVKTKSDGSLSLDLNALAGHNKSQIDIEDNVAKAFSELGYSSDQIEVISQALKKEFVSVYAAVQQNNLNKTKSKGSKNKLLSTEWESARDDISKLMKKYGYVSPSNKTNILDRVRDYLKNTKYYEKNKLDDVKKEFGKLKIKLGRNSSEITSRVNELLDDMSSGVAVYMPKSVGNEIIEYAMSQMGFETKNIPNYLEFNSSQSEFHDNLLKGLEKSGFSPNEIKIVFNSIFPESKDYYNLLKEKAEKLLKEKAEKKQGNFKKNELMRLADLKSLGVFDSSHKNSLYRIIGVDSLDAESMGKIDEILDRYSQIRKLLDAKGIDEISIQSISKEIQDQINKIVTNTMYNKSVSFKVGKAAQYTMSQVSIGILGNAVTMVKNLVSGMGRMLDSYYLLKKQGLSNRDAVSIWYNAFVDVGFKRGVQESLEKGNLNSNRYLNDVYREHKIFSLNNKKDIKGIAQSAAKSFFKLATFSFHVLGNAVDSANKAVYAHNEFIMGYHQMLLLSGKTHEEATKLINDNLFDSIKHKDAIEFAEDLYRIAKITPSGNAITRLANQVTRSNILTSGEITKGMLNGILTSAYRQASIALGHEMQDTKLSWIVGIPGKMSEIVQNSMNEKVKTLVSNENYRKLGGVMLFDSVFNQMFFLFAKGGSAWVELKLQDMMGFSYLIGKVNDNDDKILKQMDNLLDQNSNEYTRKQLTEDILNKIRDDDNRIARGVTGLGMTLLFTSLFAMYAKYKDDDKEDSIMSAIDKIILELKNHPRLSRIFKGIWPSLFSNIYSLRELQNTEGIGYVYKLMNYMGTQYNIGNPYSLDANVEKIGTKLQTDPSEAYGIIGQYFGSKFNLGAALGYNNLKTAEFLSKINSTEKEQWVKSTSVKSGLFSAMMLDKMFSDSSILPTIDFFQDYGISQIPGIAAGKEEGLKNAKYFATKTARNGTDVSINDVKELKQFADSKKKLINLKMPYKIKGKSKTYYKVVFSNKKENEYSNSEVDMVWDYLQTIK